jgi:uncharacterized protein YpmS
MMKKHIPAILATLMIIGFLVLAMGVTGISALTNRVGTPNANLLTSASGGSDQSQLDLLQSRINEYQQREQQYQQLLDDDQVKIQQETSQIQQFKQLLVAMQQHGLIQIRDDGTIMLARQSSD